MQVRFVTQPFADGEDLRDFFQEVADDAHMSTVRFAAAWAKRSGLTRAAPALRTVRARGGRVLAVVGVSEGGATEQGMRDLIDLADEAYVYYHPGRTFHPKVYLAEGDDRAVLLVGSHNMTAGGLAWNYEAALWCTLDLNQAEDRRVRDDVVAYVDRLVSERGACVALDAGTLERLLADGTLLVQDERRAHRGRLQPEPGSPEDVDDVEVEPDTGTGGPVFTTSGERMRSMPALPRAAADPGRAEVSIATAGPRARPAVPRMGLMYWSKTLESTDAQKPPSPRSNPTGNLRLSRENYAIDQTTY